MDTSEMLQAAGMGTNILGTVKSIADPFIQQNMSYKLMDKQYQYNKKAMQDQANMQLDMFNKTGYEARTQQMKKAGLNPALIYGTGASGGGGVTGNISAPQVSGQTAPNMSASTSNFMQSAAYLLPLAKMKSEIAVNESIAKLNEANVPKSGSEAELASQKAKTEILTRYGISLDNSIREVNLEIAKGSQEANIKAAIAAAEKVENEAKMYKGKAEEALNSGKISTEMYNTTMLQKQADLKNTMAEMLSNFAKSKLSQRETEAITTELTQGWQKLQLENQSQKIEWLKNQINNIKDLDIAQIEAITRILSSLLGGTSTITGAGILKGRIK